jgi:2,4-dienoyl-CoA reductase-like NADH-dependent reductase (Old Yellow Enzyme family)
MSEPVDLFAPLPFACGQTMKNRFMLAPLTNLQSHPDGILSDDEFKWLSMRATGGFGLTMTCAAHVMAKGQGFAGQLGIFGDEHIPGLSRLAAAIKSEGSLAVVQLHHAGVRSPAALIHGPAKGPSDDEETGALAMTEEEVEGAIASFIAAAERAKRAGFDGVEAHGAHGYLLCSFLSPQYNRREDRFGGSLENRAGVVLAVLKGIRERCGPDFSLGLRLSPERFGLDVGEIRQVATEAMGFGGLDYLDMSLWDVRKQPNDEAYAARPLLDWFTDLPRGTAKLGAAGKVMSAADARFLLEKGCDFAVVGRAAILRHDFPRRVAADADYASPTLPVTAQHLTDEGLGPAFLDYMRTWKGFVEG